MSWIPSLFFFLLGLAIGYLIRWRFRSSGGDQAKLQRELAQARFDLEQQRQEVADYFEQSREVMAQLSGSLDKANRYWNDSAQSLLGDHQLPPLPSAPLTQEHNGGVVESLPPNDYVQGSHGIITKPIKAVNG
ncbi:YhcB family protein [Ferrimonas gelatinilytica]|uniref:Z-ring associated protein G n=1 Tax=Ferrimonas gelatinilytica TaxID=1255257 RepID=A0ABP9SFA1_9GAMM